MQVAQRLPRLGELVADCGADALVVVRAHDVQYLTGFAGSAGMLVVTASKCLLVTDGRYRDQAEQQSAAAGVEVAIEIGTLPEQLAAIERRCAGCGFVAVEEAEVSWGLARALQSRLAPAELLAVGPLVARLRVVKDAGELARIERAADLADVALAQLKEQLVTGCTEGAFAAALDHEMRRRGADDVAFSTIVASGPNAAMPHARPSARRIEPGDLVVVDFGACVDGYRSDMTRTFSVGEPGDDRVEEMVEAVQSSQRAGLLAVRAGASGGDVDAACRAALEQVGMAERFTHGTGHGVGLEIHEAPALAKGSPAILEEHAVVTVEPGVYLPGLGGVRIEDTVAVTKDGFRSLTKSTKDWKL